MKDPNWRRIGGIASGAIDLSLDGQQVRVGGSPSWPWAMLMITCGIILFFVRKAAPASFGGRPAAEVFAVIMAAACWIGGVFLLRFETFSADKRTGRWRYTVRALVAAKNLEGEIRDIEHVSYEQLESDDGGSSPASARIRLRVAGNDLDLGAFHTKSRHEVANLLANWLGRTLRNS